MVYLSQRDLSKLFKAFYEFESERHRMCVLTLFYSGARISQVLALKGTDVFELDGKYVLRIGAAKRGHSGIRTIRIDSDPAFDQTPLISMAARAGSSKLFGALDRFYWDKVIKRVGTKAGINDGFLHSHAIRHGVAMLIFAQTQRIGCVSEFLLHRSPSSAFSYLKENDGQRAQAAMDSLHLS